MEEKKDVLKEIRESVERQNAMLKEITARLSVAELAVRKLTTMLRGSQK